MRCFSVLSAFHRKANKMGIIYFTSKHGRLSRWRKWRSCDVGEAKEGLENEQSSFSKLSVTSPTSQLSLQPFRCFTYVTALSPTLPLLHLRHSSFSNLSFASHTSQVLHLCHQASRPWCKTRMRYERPIKWHAWTELILQAFRHFTYVTAHSPTLPSIYLRHPSFALPFSTLLSLLIRHRLFTYVTWRAGYDLK